MSREADATSLGFKDEHEVTDEPLIIVEYENILSGAEQSFL